MQQTVTLRHLAAALSIVVALALSSCARPPPEQAVRARIQALQAAIDGRDAGDVQALLDEAFVGNDGLDRRGARQLAAAVFLRHREIAARIGPVDVRLRGENEAIATFDLLATGGSGGLLPERGQLYRVETGWRMSDGDWRLLNASWTPSL